MLGLGSAALICSLALGITGSARAQSTPGIDERITALETKVTTLQKQNARLEARLATTQNQLKALSADTTDKDQLVTVDARLKVIETKLHINEVHPELESDLLSRVR
ncbi:MAG: hypothetical protein JWM74_643 [Myxococcaceae bacterium]|nr:hypothetical protein [Myxococcaceae bacterium]